MTSSIVHSSRRKFLQYLQKSSRRVNGRMTVIVDSGFRRGTDVVKALAVGAHAVRIGRPWSVASFTKASGRESFSSFR